MLEMVIQTMDGDDVSSLGEALETLGARHVSYGVHPVHYGVLETALLRTLGGALTDWWTTEVRKGWAAVVKFISKGMQAGAALHLEIIKVERRKLEREKSASLRMTFIKRSEGTSRLSREGKLFPRSRFHTTSNCRPQDSVQPPRMPTRRSTANSTISPGLRRMKISSSSRDSSCSPPRPPKRSEEDDATVTTIGSSTVCLLDNERESMAKTASESELMLLRGLLF